VESEDSFTKEMFMTAGDCLECEGEKCGDTGERMTDFADRVISPESSGVATCQGLPVRNYDMEIIKELESLARKEKLVNRDYEADERLAETSRGSASASSGQYLLLILSFLALRS